MNDKHMHDDDDTCVIHIRRRRLSWSFAGGGVRAY